MEQLLRVIMNLGLPLFVLLIAYLIGTALERRHYRSIREREARLRKLPAVTFRDVPRGWSAASGELVTGNVVISIDYFKRFLAGLRGLVGGRMKSYEPLLDRGRREALLRMKESAISRGFDAVINVRLETSRLASSSKGGQGTAGVEILAFGTALKLSR